MEQLSSALLHSWGPDDNGKTVDGPHQLAQVCYFVIVSMCTRKCFIETPKCLWEAKQSIIEDDVRNGITYPIKLTSEFALNCVHTIRATI